MSLDEFRTLLDRHARPDWTTAIDGVLISKVDRPDPPAPSMSGTVVAVIAQGAKRLALGERVYEYGPGQYLVASVDLPVTGQFTQADPERPPSASASPWNRPPWPNSCCRPVQATSPQRWSHAVGDRRQ